MTHPKINHELLVKFAPFSPGDVARISECRRSYNRLGFGYQMAFVRLLNRFPIQQPFEIAEDIIAYASIQLNISSKEIDSYAKRQATISEHQELIRNYLGLYRLAQDDILLRVKKFIFEEACRIEQTGALLSKTEQFLKEENILKPAEDTLRRLIANQREEAKGFIFQKIESVLSEEIRKTLDQLLETENTNISALQILKQTPGKPSPSSMLQLIKKMEMIESVGILNVDLSWLNNNFQRALARYAKHCTVTRLKYLETAHRQAVLTCFLWQTYRDTVDFIVDMYDKIIDKIYNHAQNDLDDHAKSQGKMIRNTLHNYSTLVEIILDDSLDEQALRKKVFSILDRKELESQITEVKTWLTGKHSHVFNLVKDRFGYIRQFLPSFLKHIALIPEGEQRSPVMEAMDILRQMNESNKRKLTNDAPLEFIPKKLRPFVLINGNPDKPAWECALLTAVRDEIKSGNVSVKMSKRFGRFDDFFISECKWQKMREAFFKRAGMPCDPEDAGRYLKKRLDIACDKFLEKLPQNPYASVDGDGWHLSADLTDKLDPDSEKKLDVLKKWLSNHMRVIKLPELLIEVDNELKITRLFLPAAKQDHPQVEEICEILAAIMAHGCNIGSFTMSHLTGISYHRIKNITDWMLTEETLRDTLATVVNAISRLDITHSWGTGRTSSSDGQRFELKRKVLQQTYSTKFNDFALEFYSFIADNYAPFYSLPIECTDRDAPFVLDGILYNESDLPLEEHYVDTHGYTENNFAAFAMLGLKFSPRIKGLHKQRIYRINKDKDYQALKPLIDRADRTIHMDWIVDHWDRMSHFYASLVSGHVTASTAMKRLNGFSSKNHFYRANRELGRIFKTEHILTYMSDKTLRQRTRRGLLKGEQLHSLARDLNYGKRGRISRSDFQEQKNSCSCLTLILACIIYWQAKEMNRVVLEGTSEAVPVDFSLIEHVSPITWDNVIIYGEYVLNRNLVKL